jgi:hypothetical protein
MFLCEEILFTLFSHCDVETLIQCYTLNKRINKILNDGYILNSLANRYSLDECNAFTELITIYDKKYVTKRCYNYWSLTDCILWNLKKGCDIFDI